MPTPIPTFALEDSPGLLIRDGDGEAVAILSAGEGIIEVAVEKDVIAW